MFNFGGPARKRSDAKLFNIGSPDIVKLQQQSRKELRLKARANYMQQKLDAQAQVPQAGPTTDNA